MENAIAFVFQIAILIFSVVIHEVSHGYAALLLGDRTALYAGRLTLNPIKHVDPFGSLILPILSSLLGGPIFGWAKPVPYNPYNLRNQKWGPAVVGIAGPGSNFFLAVLAGFLIRFFSSGFGESQFLQNFLIIASVVALINIFLCIFNMMPIPPLDGSKVLFAVLPAAWRGMELFLERYGIIILFAFIFFFSRFLIPIVSFFFEILTGSGFM